MPSPRSSGGAIPAVKGYRRSQAGTQPNHLHPAYASSVLRAPSQPLVRIPQTLSEVTGPLFAQEAARAKACDLTRRHAGEAIGERIIVSGRVMDEDGRPVPNTLIEIWQANAAGRYFHSVDQHNAPLDPNFAGCGQVSSDADGRYRFVSIRPGAYPWRNHYNAWRPSHIHFSVFDWERTVPEQAIGYQFNFILRGRDATPFEAKP